MMGMLAAEAWTKRDHAANGKHGWLTWPYRTITIPGVQHQF
jgi:hypothetical protein